MIKTFFERIELSDPLELTTGDKVRTVTFSTNNYVSFTANEYEFREWDDYDIEKYVKEFVSDVYDVEYFINNPTKTFTDLVEELCDYDVFVYEVLDGENWYETPHGIGVWENTSGGQISDNVEPIQSLWDKYHLEETVSEETEQEILKALENRHFDVLEQADGIKLNLDI